MPVIYLIGMIDMKPFIVFVLSLLVLIIPALCYAEIPSTAVSPADPANKTLVSKPINTYEEDAYSEVKRIKDEEESHSAKGKSNQKEGFVFKGFRIFMGIGYEGYFVSKIHTFDVNLFMEYDWRYFGISLNLDCGFPGGGTHEHREYDTSDSSSFFSHEHEYSIKKKPTALLNLNAQFAYPITRQFIFSAGVGHGMAYVNETFFSVRISVGLYRSIGHFIIGGSVNYIPMFNFKAGDDHAFGFVIQIGRG